MFTENEWSRFSQKFSVDELTGCWEWTGCKNRDGYGHAKYRGKVCRTHRLAYEHMVGPIPTGLELDHLCRNTSCVNPSHLDPVTHAENIRRGDVGKNESTKTHCPYGHEYSVENTYKNPKGGRNCRSCRRQRKRAYRLKHPRTTIRDQPNPGSG